MNIEMELAAAPGASSVYVYEAPQADANSDPDLEALHVYTRMAGDDPANVDRYERFRVRV